MGEVIDRPRGRRVFGHGRPIVGVDPREVDVDASAYFAAIRSGDLERLRRLIADEPSLLGAVDKPDLDFAPDGATLASSSYALKLWRAARPAEVALRGD